MTCAIDLQSLRTRLFLAFVLAMPLMSSLFAEALQLPAAVPCGTLVEFSLTDEAQDFVDFESAVKAGESKPSVTRPAGLLVRRSPENGMRFAVFTFNVAQGRTLSKFDYILETDGGVLQPCLEMGRADSGFYDFRLNAQEGAEVFKLIFHCPQDAFEARLKLSYSRLAVPPAGDFIIHVRPAPAAAPSVSESSGAAAPAVAP